MVIPGLELSKQESFWSREGRDQRLHFPESISSDYRTAETRRGSVLSDSSGLLRKRGEDDTRVPIALRFYFSAQIIVFSAQPPD